MRMVGIEPTLCHHNWILSPARLPVPPHPHNSLRLISISCFLENVKEFFSKFAKFFVFYGFVVIVSTVVPFPYSVLLYLFLPLLIFTFITFLPVEVIRAFISSPGFFRILSNPSAMICKKFAIITYSPFIFITFISYFLVLLYKIISFILHKYF